jgi:hypothetical protein
MAHYLPRKGFVSLNVPDALDIARGGTLPVEAMTRRLALLLRLTRP